ncbi:MAG: YbiU family protein [Blastocatellia bacterium]
MHNPQQAVIDAKAALLAQMPDVALRMRWLDEWLADEVAAVQAEGADAVQQLAYRDVFNGTVSAAEWLRIRRRGCVIIRNVFDAQQASEWNAAIGRYIDDNDYYRKAHDKAGLDQYFSGLAAGRPQIFGLYWSLPQMQARQHENMDVTRRWLNRLWDYECADGANEFDPDRQCNYADRVRRREPGDTSLGLSAHCDGGSIERWFDPNFQSVYHEIFFGDVEKYDAFRAIGRTNTEEIPSPAVCSMFRTFQGWTALTSQGAGDGTLRLIPIARSMAWLLVRALQSDVAPDDLCGAQAGRALAAHPQWHQALLKALVSIPRVEPGDTVWWHPDVIHAVENEHRGNAYSNVIYIGAAPWCEKNARFLPRQAESFLLGRSSPDFAAEDYEVDFTGRARVEDLSILGKQQMGLRAW